MANKTQKRILSKKAIGLIIGIVTIVIAVIAMYGLYNSAQQKNRSASTQIQECEIPQRAQINQSDDTTLVLKKGINQTFESGPNISHKIIANKDCYALSVRQDGEFGEKYLIPANTVKYWNGSLPRGNLLVEAVQDSTLLKVERVR